MKLVIVVGLVLFVAAEVYMAEKEVSNSKDLLVVTVATEENDGFRQFIRSTKKYGLDVKVFGLGSAWRGGSMKSIGGGQKINFLKEGLNAYKNNDNLVIMFSDSYDAVFTEGKDEILSRFLKFGSKVVFAAESACWPDKSLADKYPMVREPDKRFLNSGGFIGYAREIYDLVNYQPVGDSDDDQLYYTQLYLNRAVRHEWSMKLDSRAEIFQNLNFALGEIILKYKDSHSYLYNLQTETAPIVVHGNGPIKPEFYRLSNYLADGWTPSSGCMACKEDLFDLSAVQTCVRCPESTMGGWWCSLECEGCTNLAPTISYLYARNPTTRESNYPSVLVAIFVESATPFLREFFQRVAALDYPKDRIDVYVHNNVDFHTKDVDKFVEDSGKFYRSISVISPSDNVGEAHARNSAITECTKRGCQYLLTVDSIVQITNPLCLKDLIRQNRSIVAPLMKRPGKLWSNFWGAINEIGYYARSEDYMDIVNFEKVGLWNVPYIGDILLVQARHLKALKDAYTYNSELDPDMSFCQLAREKIIFMYLSNQDYWGHLVYADEFNTSHLHSELFEIFHNRLDWETRYIHPDYSKALEKNAAVEMPCPDVYWFPIVSDTFCDEFVAELENFGKWSSGKNEDPRLAGGYENVPTVDIHMTQIGLEKQWLQFLKEYVQPLQKKVFLGYLNDPPRAIMNFIVRYRPDEQPLLRPHHDASTYTINIALNRPGIDFQGGGCNFIRYNCSITSPRKGWMFMHPGRLTHYHEGLRTTGGTRYIMISFIDP